MKEERKERASEKSIEARSQYRVLAAEGVVLSNYGVGSSHAQGMTVLLDEKQAEEMLAGQAVERA